MTPLEFIEAARSYVKKGHRTDGCTFINWMTPNKFRPACWGHDFARQGLFGSMPQSEVDVMFFKAMRFLGMPLIFALPIFLFTFVQGQAREKLNLPLFPFVVIIVSGVTFWIMHTKGMLE